MLLLVQLGTCQICNLVSLTTRVYAGIVQRSDGTTIRQAQDYKAGAL